MPLKNNNKKNLKKNIKQSINKRTIRKRSFRNLSDRNSRYTRRDPEFSKMTFVLNLEKSKSNSKSVNSNTNPNGPLKNVNNLKDSSGKNIKQNEKENSKGILKSTDQRKHSSAPSILINRTVSLRSNPSILRTRLSDTDSVQRLSNLLDDNDEEVVVNVRSFTELLRSARRMQETMNTFLDQMRIFQEEISNQYSEIDPDENSERLRREVDRVQRVRDMVIAKNNIKRQDTLKMSSERFDNMLKSQLNRVTNAKFTIQKNNSLPNITNLLHGRLVKTKLFEKLSSSILMKDEFKESKNNCTALIPAYKTELIFGSKSQIDPLGKQSNEIFDKILPVDISSKSIRSSKTSDSNFDDSVN